MRALIAASLRLRLPVVALSVILMVVGVRAANDAPFDVFPEFAPPLVEIQTEAPGLSSSDVEALISVPLEAAMNGVPGLDVLRSKSVLGLSSVVLIFENGTERIPARQLVQERLARVAPTLPAVAHPPVIMSPLSSLSRVMKIGMSSSTLSQMDLTTLARWTVRPRLMAVPGVANVAIWGQRDRQLQVLVDPDRLRANGVTLQDVVTSTRDAMSVTAGGFLESPNQRMARDAHVAREDRRGTGPDGGRRRGHAAGRSSGSRTVHSADPPARWTSPTSSKAPAADRRWRHQRRTGAAPDRREAARGQHAAGDARRRDGLGRPQAGPRGRGRRLDDLSPRDLHRDVAGQPQSRAAGRAACSSCIVLAVFLWDWRTAVISLTAIPLSLVAAALVLSRSGGTLDTMVIAGLIIALGEVVDDAIIDVENIVRRLRLNEQRGGPAAGVRRRARRLARSPQRRGLRQPHRRAGVPAGVLPRRAGRLVLPAAGALLRAGDRRVAAGGADRDAGAVADAVAASRPREREAPLVDLAEAWLSTACCRVWSSAPRRALGVIAASRSLAAAVAFPFLGEEFLPHFKEYDFLMHWVEKPGTSLDAMRRITLRASDELRAIPGVRNFGAHIGRAEVADEVVGINFTELWISLDPSVDYARDRREGAVGRRWLSRPAARSADVSAGADQGSADRRERHDRGADLRSGARRAAAQGRRGGEGR